VLLLLGGCELSSSGSPCVDVVPQQNQRVFSDNRRILYVIHTHLHLHGFTIYILVISPDG